MNKNQRRELAIKRAKRKKTLIITAVILIVAALIGLAIFMSNRPNGNLVYANAGQTVTLRPNGRFSAILSHGASRSGRYTESREDGVTTVTFTMGNTTQIGTISGTILTIPAEWDDGHGHGLQFALRQ